MKFLGRFSIGKGPKQAMYTAHRCNKKGCGQFLRNEEDLADHKRNTKHCTRCGFGYAPIQELSMTAMFCLACALDVEPFPSDKKKVC